MKEVIAKKIINIHEAEDFAAALISLRSKENQDFSIIEWRSELYCADTNKAARTDRYTANQMSEIIDCTESKAVTTSEIDRVALILKRAAKRIIFTFRTEPGYKNTEAMQRKYYNMLYEAAGTRNIDYIDIEIDGILKESELIDIIRRAKDKGKKIIASIHVYSSYSNDPGGMKTNSNANTHMCREALTDDASLMSDSPENSEIEFINKAERIGADVVKMAVQIPTEKEGEDFIKTASEEVLKLGMQPVIIVLGEAGRKLRRKSEEYGVIWNFIAFSSDDVSDIGQEILYDD